MNGAPCKVMTRRRPFKPYRGGDDPSAVPFGSVQQYFIPCAAVVFVPSFLSTVLRGVFCRARDKTVIVGFNEKDKMNGDEFLRQRIKEDFEDQLDSRVKRVKNIKLQNIIPYHWFASAASDCAGMYVSEYYYGCISISQAYVEALSKYLCEYHQVRKSGDIKRRWKSLFEANLITSGTRDAALAIFEDRNDFHHLNKSITDEKMELEKRAEECLTSLTTIESEIFGYSYSDSEPGKHVLNKPEYWPSSGPEMALTSIRKLW